jgi:carbamate kinase
VASPEPLRVLETPAALALLAAGFVVVAAGGGGIPTVELDAPDATADPHGTGDPDGTGGRDGTRRLAGVEAVIDKDLTAGVLARDLEADVLVIATDVPNAVLEYGTARARPLEEVPVGLMRRHAADGHFAGGSMGPKVEAVCRFVESTGRRAAITSLDRIADAVAGTAGTRVVPDLP